MNLRPSSSCPRRIQNLTSLGTAWSVAFRCVSMPHSSAARMLSCSESSRYPLKGFRRAQFRSGHIHESDEEVKVVVARLLRLSQFEKLVARILADGFQEAIARFPVLIFDGHE